MGGIVTGSAGVLTVPQGGTGATSFTVNGILYGNGASALLVTAAPAVGQFLGVTAGIPTFKDLTEADSVTKGIVNLSNQFLGTGTKSLAKLVVNGPIDISIAGVHSQHEGKSYFGDDVWIKHTQSIIVYNAGVTNNAIDFLTGSSEIRVRVADGATETLQLRLQSFTGNTCDLVHTDGSTVPSYSVNGTLGDTGATYANPTSIVTKGGIVTSCTAGAAGKGTVTAFTATASATVANTTTETTLIGSGVGSLTFAANSLVAGRSIRIRARGYWGTDAVTAGTMRWRIKLGSTTVLDTGVITPTVGITNLLWKLDADITCRTTGASGTVFGQGYVDRQEMAGIADFKNAMVNTATTTIDTTAAQALDVTFAWGTADADNTITSSNVTVEVLN
ncbi:MAG: hypothetical protein ACREJC_17380 [Tepidisphaeraceae bacterium]